MSENEQLLNNIKYNDVLDMLGLTLLIYDYGKKIDYVKNETFKKCEWFKKGKWLKREVV